MSLICQLDLALAPTGNCSIFIPKWHNTERTLLLTKSQWFQGFISPWWQLSWEFCLNQDQGTMLCYILKHAHATHGHHVLVRITISDNCGCFAAQGKYQASLSIWTKHLQDTLYLTGKHKAIFLSQFKQFYFKLDVQVEQIHFIFSPPGFNREP